MEMKKLKQVKEGHDKLLSLSKEFITNIPDSNLIDLSFIPTLAKDPLRFSQAREASRNVETIHRLIHGDARDFSFIDTGSIHLVLTSPPYWKLKGYPKVKGQLGNIENYEEFLVQINQVWEECFRVLIPGGRLVIVVGDVCLSRRQYGRTRCFPTSCIDTGTMPKNRI